MTTGNHLKTIPIPMPHFGDGEGARMLSNVLFLSGYDDELASHLANIGTMLSRANQITQDGGKATTEEERVTLSRAARLHAVLLDDGPDRFIARALAEKAGEDPDDPVGPAHNRALLFSSTENMLNSFHGLVTLLLRHPEFVNAHQRILKRLFEAIDHLDLVLHGEPEEKTRKEKKNRQGLRQRFQDVLGTYQEGFSRSAHLFSYGVEVFGGDPESLSCLQEALEQVAQCIRELREERATTTPLEEDPDN